MSSEPAGSSLVMELPLPPRPAMYIKTVTFSDGTNINLEEDDIVVFVGPNNAGKSAALKEIQAWFGNEPTHVVTKEVTFKTHGDKDAFQNYLDRTAMLVGDVPDQQNYAGMGFSIYKGHLPFFGQNVNKNLFADFLSTRLPTENRIGSADAAGPIALYRSPPKHPIHLLLMDERLAADISDLFKRAFNEDLIPFRGGGSDFPLYVGNRPNLEATENELSKSFVERLLSESKPLKLQGDGMRSFVTVLLFALVSDNHSAVFLDEPEAFLHPPQARLLGTYIATQRRSKSQLIVATHSSDILQGLLEGGSKNVKIVRISRAGNINRVRLLEHTKTQQIASDTLLRYSRVLDGVFHKSVIIAESDSDCLFYSAVLNTPEVGVGRQPDVLFIHAAGKHRMARLAEMLRALDVPVAIIADIDVLDDEFVLRGILESLGGEWALIESHWKALKIAVESATPPLTGPQLKALIEQQIESLSKTSSIPSDVQRKVTNIFRMAKPWAAVKQSGRSAFRGAGTVKHFDDLCSYCSSYGLWIVPVGELEGFCRTIEAAHGPAFVQKLINERDLSTDVELTEARVFVKRVWEGLNHIKPSAEAPGSV